MTTPEKQLTNHQKNILAIHFDPKWGSPYWIQRAGELMLNPLRDFECVDDLLEFGPMDLDALADEPVENFVPRSFQEDRQAWNIVQTGGTTGRPKFTVYRPAEFHVAFVLPFKFAAAARDFPRRASWLYVGPTGPHVIGRAASACAQALNSPAPFMVDFDPRWIKKFDPHSAAFQRYFDHVVDQAMKILESQHVEILFTTPRVLRRLGEDMPATRRNEIRGVHFGGMTLSPEEFRQFEEWFPAAVFISGYGNTLFGMCPEFCGRAGSPLDFFPWGDRLIFRSIKVEDNGSDSVRLGHPAGQDEVGQVVFSRFDETFLILNCMERDQGTLIQPPAQLHTLGFTGPGIRNPEPLKLAREAQHAKFGLY